MPRLRRIVFDSRPACFIAIVLGVVLLRSGFSAGSAEVDALTFARTFPTPVASVTSWAVISPALTHVLHLTTGREWLVLHGLLLIAVLVFVGYRLWRRVQDQVQWRVAVIWIALSAAPSANLQWLRPADIWTLLGGALIGLGTGIGSAIVGGVIIGASSPEQGLIALAALACVLFAQRRRDPSAPTAKSSAARIGSTGVAMLITRLLIMIWFSRSGVDVPSRASLFGPLLGRSLRYSTGLGTTGIYGWYGVAWIAVIICLWAVREDRKGLAATIAGLVVLPALATVLTTDGTRVFAAISWPALLAALVSSVRGKQETPAPRRWLERLAPIALVGSLVMPAIVTTGDGQVFAPWGYVAAKLF